MTTSYMPYGKRRLQSGRRLFNVHLTDIGNDRLQVDFAWHASAEWTALKDQIKAMEGSKFNFDDKVWTIAASMRNLQRIQHLDYDVPSPFEHYHQPYPMLTPRRDAEFFARVGKDGFMPHQLRMLSIMAHRRRVLMAAEMGTGKTLATIEALEHIRPRLVWWVGPRLPLQEVQGQFKFWEAQVHPIWMTYEGFVSMVTNWPAGRTTPDAVVFDESVALKTPNTKRSKIAQYFCDNMRLEHENPTIILLCGAPAPRCPVDWWKQLEIVAPGYLDAGTPDIFRRQLSLSVMDRTTATPFPRFICWWDDESRCAECGQPEDDDNHQLVAPRPMSEILNSIRMPQAAVAPSASAGKGIQSEAASKKELQATGIKTTAYKHRTPIHKYRPSENKVVQLYETMNGPVHVERKDNMNLPPKMYRRVMCKPTPQLLRAAKLAATSAPTVISALSQCRALSDGFRYHKVEDNSREVVCPRCKGSGVDMLFADGKEPEPVNCPKCDGNGLTAAQTRETKRTGCPKDDALRDLLEELDEVGRVVIFGGFQATITNIVNVCQDAGWFVIRADGTTKSMPYSVGATEPLTAPPLEVFQDPKKEIPKIAWVAHPAVGKAGVNLTAAPMIIYYSNTFNLDDRIQSEERIHRLGMNVNLGATIVDLLHLPTDAYVLNNLLRKRRLQDLSLVGFHEECAFTLED